MNFCTKCESYYQSPGTCNCFAVSQPRPWPFEPAPTIAPPTVPGDGTGDAPPRPPYQITGGQTYVEGYGVILNSLSDIAYDPTTPKTLTLH